MSSPQPSLRRCVIVFVTSSLPSRRRCRAAVAFSSSPKSSCHRCSLVFVASSCRLIYVVVLPPMRSRLRRATTTIAVFSPLSCCGYRPIAVALREYMSRRRCRLVDVVRAADAFSSSSCCRRRLLDFVLAPPPSCRRFLRRCVLVDVVVAMPLPSRHRCRRHSRPVAVAFTSSLPSRRRCRSVNDAPLPSSSYGHWSPSLSHRRLVVTCRRHQRKVIS